MTPSAISWRENWLNIKADLMPYDGRWEQAWRIALLCSLMTLIAMNYGIPETSISCYVIFFVMRSDAIESSLMAIALVVLVSIVVVLMVFLVSFTIDSPPARLAVLVVFSTALLFLGVNSALGPLGGIIALVIGFIMTMLVYTPIGELATRALLYAWLMTAAPMGLILLLNLFAGRSPKKVLQHELARRLELAANTLTGKSSLTAMRHEIGLGIEAQQKRLSWLSLFYLASKKEQLWLGIANIQCYRVLLMAYSYANQARSEDTVPQELVQRCYQAAEQIRHGQRPTLSIPLYEGTNVELRQIVNALDQMVNAVDPPKIEKEKNSFFEDDAFTNPEYIQIGLKGTLAVVLCYLFYSYFDWQGIHTALVTCYVTTLANTGETVNKLVLRIIGCLIGVTIALFVILVLFPLMTSIGSLMIVVFVVCLLAAWVMLGSERVSYAGLQIAFAFLLITLSSPGPHIDTDLAKDRVIGILVGNLMMYLIFTHIWPNSVMRSVNKKLSSIRKRVERLQTARATSLDSLVQSTAILSVEFVETRYLLSRVLFEPESTRPALSCIEQAENELELLQKQMEQLRERVKDWGGLAA